jgi:Flp pilus assembly protein TadD
MEQLSATDGGVNKEFSRAQAALAVDDTLTALTHLERALKLHDTPSWHSFLGYCIAKERGQHRKGMELCRSALELEPDRPVHYCNLARIHLMVGDKVEALRVLRDGMVRGGGPEIERLLENLGVRKKPLFPMLSRANPVNRYLGLLLSRLGLR